MHDQDERERLSRHGRGTRSRRTVVLHEQASRRRRRVAGPEASGVDEDSEIEMSRPKNKSFEITWPLFGDKAPFPADPAQSMQPFALGDAELRAFAELEDLPESSEQAERDARTMRETLPPHAPEWMRAARALADWLEQRIAAGRAAPVEQAA